LLDRPVELVMSIAVHKPYIAASVARSAVQVYCCDDPSGKAIAHDHATGIEASPSRRLRHGIDGPLPGFRGSNS
jgi:hypothetical protein